MWRDGYDACDFAAWGIHPSPLASRDKATAIRRAWDIDRQKVT